MKKNLFVVNTVYQVLVAMWMQYTVLREDTSDIIVSNHMNGGTEICERLKTAPLFRHCYFVQSLDYCKFKEKNKKTNRHLNRAIPTKELNSIALLKESYDQIVVANVDRFFKLLFDVMKRRNHDTQVVLFEDGLSTYSKLFESYLNSCKQPQMDFKHRLLNKTVFRTQYSYESINSLYLFNPKLIDWSPTFQIHGLDKIRKDDKLFLNMVNYVFAYDEDSDEYDRPYIFMEESYSADGYDIKDVELVNKIAQRVGKENIIIKIHPRNPINRFYEEGFKTNQNTAIPWEVIIMNMESLEKKTLITIASCSVLNPYLVMGTEVRGYSLINLVDSAVLSKSILGGEYGKYMNKLLKSFEPVIHLCESINEIQ